MTPSLTPRLGGALFLALIGSAAAADASLDAGRALFNETAQPQCALCHSLKDAGAEGEIGPNLDDFKPTVEQVRAAVTSGIGIMPGFAETLTDAEIETLSIYVATVAGGSDAAANSDASAPTEDAAAAEPETPGAEILAQGNVHDADLEGHIITVPEVRMSPDLKLATVYVMPLGGGRGAV